MTPAGRLTTFANHLQTYGAEQAIIYVYGLPNGGAAERHQLLIADILSALGAPSTGGQLGPGTPPDTAWNLRASPPGGEGNQGDTSSISPITSASKSAPSGSEPSAARDHRNCAVCGKPSKLGDLVGWVLDQDSRLRFCPDCQQTKETGQ